MEGNRVKNGEVIKNLEKKSEKNQFYPRGFPSSGKKWNQNSETDNFWNYCQKCNCRIGWQMGAAEGPTGNGHHQSRKNMTAMVDGKCRITA